MRVMLVDDHTLFVSGLKNLLEAGGIEVVGTAASGTEALQAVQQWQPNLILMDIHMTDGDGLTAARLIRRDFPQIKVVMLSMNTDDESLFEAVRRGAVGFLLKNLNADELFSCLERVNKGEMVFAAGLVDRVLHEFSRTGEASPKAVVTGVPEPELTARQLELLQLVAGGLTYKETAARLDISETTVKYHMKEILTRLRLENRAQAIAYITELKFKPTRDKP